MRSSAWVTRVFFVYMLVYQTIQSFHFVGLNGRRNIRWLPKHLGMGSKEKNVISEEEYDEAVRMIEIDAEREIWDEITKPKFRQLQKKPKVVNSNQSDKPQVDKDLQDNAKELQEEKEAKEASGEATTVRSGGNQWKKANETPEKVTIRLSEHQEDLISYEPGSYICQFKTPRW
jgi:hypothetical protein